MKERNTTELEDIKLSRLMKEIRAAVEGLNLFRELQIKTDFENYRKEFTWSRSLNALGEPLSHSQDIPLANLSDNHLEALVSFTEPSEGYYPNYVQLGFITEQKYRELKDIRVEDYEDE